MIKVLVADDHPVVRDGLRALFAEYPSIELIGEAATGREAIKAAVINKPESDHHGPRDARHRRVQCHGGDQQSGT
jgi:DNA-binding LytR/AlgR family response regulator